MNSFLDKSRRVIEQHFTWFAALSLVLITVVLYGHALDSGFFLDDANAIQNERLMLQQDILPLLEKFKLRFVGHLTFWLNYQVSGEDPAAYRAVNILIHVINGCLVFILSAKLLDTAVGLNPPTNKNRWLALAVALLFISHPLQTQAVTYIVQRLASLVTLFYLFALIAWLEIFSSKTLRARVAWIFIFGTSGLLALFTKQNAFTLPIVLIALDLILLKRVGLKVWGYLGALLAVLTLVFVVVFPEYVARLDEFTRETSTLSRLEYFSSQWVVLWIYLYKLVWPFPQLLDYGLSPDALTTNLKVLAGFGHVLALGFATFYARKLPLVAFGVWFFYLSHTVESGFIPITDLAFEHRNYLPSVGAFLALVSALGTIADRYINLRKPLFIGFLLGIVFFSQATWARNQQWLDHEALLKQDVAANPENNRALYALALWHQRNEGYDKSLALMTQLARRSGGKLSLLESTTYVANLINLNLFKQAKRALESLIEQPMDRKSKAALLRQYGVVLTAEGSDAAAVRVLERSNRIVPLDYDGSLAYGFSLIQVGQFGKAKTHIDTMVMRFGNRTRLKLLRKTLVTTYRSTLKEADPQSSKQAQPEGESG